MVAISRADAPIDVNARLYQTSAITVLGYLAQFFEAPKCALSRDIHALHNFTRMPPSTFGK